MQFRRWRVGGGQNHQTGLNSGHGRASGRHGADQGAVRGGGCGLEESTELSLLLLGHPWHGLQSRPRWWAWCPGQSWHLWSLGWRLGACTEAASPAGRLLVYPSCLLVCAYSWDAAWLARPMAPRPGASPCCPDWKSAPAMAGLAPGGGSWWSVRPTSLSGGPSKCWPEKIEFYRPTFTGQASKIEGSNLIVNPKCHRGCPAHLKQADPPTWTTSVGRGGPIGVPSHVKTHPHLSHLSATAWIGLSRSNFTGSKITGKFEKKPPFRNALL